MNPAKFAPCIEDIRTWAAKRRSVEGAIVFGSVARGMAGEESDLDLLVFAPRTRHRALAHELYDIGAQHDVTVSPYLVERAELGTLDRQFVESVTTDGKTLKGLPLDPTVGSLDLRPHYLVTLFLDHLPQRGKVRLSRELYGYRSSRRYKRAVYASAREGFVDRVGGRKLGRGTFLVPASAWSDLEALLERHRGKRWAFKVWVQAP